MRKNMLCLPVLLALAVCGCSAEAEPLDIPDADIAGLLEMPNKPKMVMVDGAVYCDTGRRSSAARCGMMDGEITSETDKGEEPTEDHQSNFGTGFGYQYGADDTIEVLYEDEWCIFERRDELVWYEGQVRSRAEVSDETVEWLEWYDSLTREEQLAVSTVPQEFADMQPETEDAGE